VQPRDAIIDATIRIIGRGGVDAVTHRAVAREAGVSLSSTTYHFRSRDDIIGEALRVVVRREIERIQRAADELGDRLSDIEAWTDTLLEWLAEQLQGDGRTTTMGLYHLQLEAAQRPDLTPVLREWKAATMSLAERALRVAGSPRPATDARVVVAAIDGLRLDQLASPEPDAEGSVLRPAIERLLEALVQP
jgi:DNA-binding transcriptional regulator YbjK